MFTTFNQISRKRYFFYIYPVVLFLKLIFEFSIFLTGEREEKMKNNLWFIAACVMVFFAGYNMNNAAVSFPKYKVAVVDIPTILSNSEEIQTLKKEQDKEAQELDTLITKAQNDILNEHDRSKLIQKEADYRQQINTKKSDIDKKYNEKLAKINKNIQTIISKEAKKSNYNLVLPAGMVISGGEDITNNVVKSMK